MSKAFGGCRRQFSNAGNLHSNLKRNGNMRNNLHPRQFFPAMTRPHTIINSCFGSCLYFYTRYPWSTRGIHNIWLSFSQITCGNVLGKHQILDGSHSASRTFFISLCTSDFLVYSETLLSNIWLTFILLQQVNKNKHNQKNFKSNIVINKSRFFLFCSQWNSLISYFYWQAVQNNMS